MKPLDFADPAAVRAWLSDLRARFTDVDALVRDMLAPPSRRELGPVLHAANYQDARDAILDALAQAGAPEPDDGDGGNGHDGGNGAVPTGDDDAPPWEHAP